MPNPDELVVLQQFLLMKYPNSTRTLSGVAKDTQKTTAEVLAVIESFGAFFSQVGPSKFQADLRMFASSYAVKCPELFVDHRLVHMSCGYMLVPKCVENPSALIQSIAEKVTTSSNDPTLTQIAQFLISSIGQPKIEIATEPVDLPLDSNGQIRFAE